MIDRRSFIKVAAPALIGARGLARAQSPSDRRRFGDDDLPLARTELLNLINSDRAKFGLRHLQLDELANKVATEHARDMSQGQFLSHWGSDGRKPYHRFSFAGGIDAVQENASAATDIQSLTTAGIIDDLREMHQSMMREVPPYDGHRRTILGPFHTHVGFGLGFNGYNLRLDELYLARYVQLDPIAQETKPESIVTLVGRLLNSSHFLTEVDVFFEPLPQRPEIEWLRTPRSVSLPDTYKRLRPKAPSGTRYSDGGMGDFEWNRNGKFRVLIKLSDGPGIYTMELFVRTIPADRGFPGAQVCILCR